MRIICIEEHAIDPAADKAARPAVLGEAPYFGLMDSPRAASRLPEAIAANPARLSGFAILPWQDPKAAAAELDGSVTQLGLKGVLLMGHPGARFLDDPGYAPVLEKPNELQVPLYAHPGIPRPDVQQAYYSGFSPEVTAQFSLTGWGWHREKIAHLNAERLFTL